MKDTYNALRHVNPQASWLKFVWFTNNIPKHSFIAWLVIKNALKTQDKLVEWGLRRNAVCIFCHMEIETVKHLFVW